MINIYSHSGHTPSPFSLSLRSSSDNVLKVSFAACAAAAAQKGI